MRKQSVGKLSLKRLGALFCAAGVFCLLFVTAVPVKAAQTEEPYTYQIRIYAGRQGTMVGKGEGGVIADDGMILIYDAKEYGSRVQFRLSQVRLFDNSKYYVKGLRKSGEDNSEALQEADFAVTEDQDYVVAYGILGDSVSYVINYEDENGNTLAPSETYYGNVGDKPVLAYLYIEGYRPQAYNLTKTLSKNAAENVFTFIYYPLSEDGGGMSSGNPGVGADNSDVAGDVGASVPGAVVPGGDGAGLAGDGAGLAGDGAGANGGNGAGPGGDGGPGPGGAADPGVDVPDDAVPLDDSPDDMVDLDDEKVPLAVPDFLRIVSDARLLGIPVGVVLVCTAILIGCFIWLIWTKRKEVSKD